MNIKYVHDLGTPLGKIQASLHFSSLRFYYIMNIKRVYVLSSPFIIDWLYQSGYSQSVYATSSTSLPLRGISAGALTPAETGKSLPDEVKIKIAVK